MKYTFKTVPTNYIVWQTVLIPNFSQFYARMLMHVAHPSSSYPTCLIYVESHL